jgi:hypothetical protein
VNPLFLLAAFLAEIIGTVAGFGSSTILLPIALVFFNFPAALVLVAFVHLFGNIGRVSFFKHGLDKPILVQFGLPSVLLTVAGALLVSRVNQDLLTAILGLFLVVYGLVFFKREIVVKSSPKNMVIGGAASGFLAGLIGAGGAMRGAFLASFGLPKQRYMATAAALAIAVDATRIPVYVQKGFLGEKYLAYLPVLFLLAIAGSYLGRSIVNRIPQPKFRRVVLVGLVLVGLKFLLDFAGKL